MRNVYPSKRRDQKFKDINYIFSSLFSFVSLFCVLQFQSDHARESFIKIFFFPSIYVIFLFEGKLETFLLFAVDDFYIIENRMKNGKLLGRGTFYMSVVVFGRNLKLVLKFNLNYEFKKIITCTYWQ